ncbi:MAG: (Fe-S)-binding protein, partial [Polaribacter sp.]|nr:(Fe-S)-binding protein [Polaribacter sp.]
MIVPTMADMMAQGKQPEVLFWVGAAGSFDDRAKKITRAFVKILQQANVDFAVLGT